MTRKSIFALATVFVLSSISLATNAYAAHNGGGHFGSGHFSGGRPSGRHFSGGHPGGGHFGAGPRAHAFIAGGHRNHFWHGRWWDYGIGPCWVWSDVYGEYVWACD
jgi:uncharacterized membrane protein